MRNINAVVSREPEQGAYLFELQEGMIHGEYFKIENSAVDGFNITDVIFVNKTDDMQLEFDLAFTDYNNSDPIESVGDDDKFAVVISTDNGATWKNMGGFLFGISNNWETLQYQVAAMIGESNVKFQVLALSDKDDQVGDGIAIDNFRVSLTPIITNTTKLELLTGMNVYPNPMLQEGHVEFNLPEAGMATIMVYDITGKEVSQICNEELFEGNHRLPIQLNNVEAGIYMVKMIFNYQVVTKRINLIR